MGLSPVGTAIVTAIDLDSSRRGIKQCAVAVAQFIAQLLHAQRIAADHLLQRFGINFQRQICVAEEPIQSNWILTQELSLAHLAQARRRKRMVA